MTNFSYIDIHDPKWPQKFADQWFDTCKDLNVDPIQEFLKMLDETIKQNDEEISLSE